VINEEPSDGANTRGQKLPAAYQKSGLIVHHEHHPLFGTIRNYTVPSSHRRPSAKRRKRGGW
jgi:hypothetical protein